MTKDEEKKFESEKKAKAKANELKREAEAELKKEKSRANGLARDLKLQTEGAKGFSGAITTGLKNSGSYLMATALVGVSRVGVGLVSNALSIPEKIKEAMKSEKRAVFTVEAIHQALSFAIAFMATRLHKGMHAMSHKIVTLAVIAGSGTLMRWLVGMFDEKLLSAA